MQPKTPIKQPPTNKFTATCGFDKTAHGATCTTPPDAGYRGASLTRNAVTGTYDAVASSPRPPQRAWHARAIDATSNTNKKATNKFEVSYARDKTAHGATCEVTATDGRPNWWQLDLRRIHRETCCSFDRGLRNRVRSVCFIREREVRHVQRKLPAQQ